MRHASTPRSRSTPTPSRNARIASRPSSGGSPLHLEHAVGREQRGELVEAAGVGAVRVRRDRVPDRFTRHDLPNVHVGDATSVLDAGARREDSRPRGTGARVRVVRPRNDPDREEQPHARAATRVPVDGADGSDLRGGARDRGARRCVRWLGRRERHDQAHAHDDAGRVSRRCRALRHVVRVQREGQGGRLDRAAARRAVEGRSAAGAGRCSASSARSRRRSREAFATADGRERGLARAGAAANPRSTRSTSRSCSGGGSAVGKWATDHGFLLTPDAPAMLDFYARRSPIFMAARFDATRARQLGQNTGDGTPIMLTIPTTRAVGAAAHPLVSGSTRARSCRPTCSCSPTTGRRCSPAVAGLSLDRDEPRQRVVALGSADRQGHVVGAESDVAHVPEAATCRPANSATTSRSA